MSIQQSLIKVGLFASVSLFAFAPESFANGCTPGFNGTAGNDTITCTGNQTAGVNAQGGAGDDTIIVTDANAAGANFDVNGGAGNDTFIITNSRVNDIRTGEFPDQNLPGNHVINLMNSEIIEQIELGTGGIDIINANNSVISRIDRNGDTGDTTLSFSNGTILQSNVNISAGSDTVLLNNSTIDGSLTVGDNTVADGADNVTLTNGSLINGSVAFGLGDNTLLVDNSRITGAVSFWDGNDTVSILNNATVGGDVVTNGGNDTVLVDNATFGNGDQIITGDGNDRITILNSDNTDNNVDATAGSGDDIIVVRNSVVNDVRGDNFMAGSDDGNDTITVTDSIIEGQVDGFGGNDVISVTNSSILNTQPSRETYLIAGDGNDQVTLTNVTVREGSLTTGDGTDDVILTGTTVGNRDGGVFGGVFTGNDDDTVQVLSGSDINGDIITGTGNDTVTITGSTVGGSVGTEGINTGAGEDVVNLAGTVSGFVDLGADDDVMTLTGASIIDTTASFDVFGNTGNDTITVNGGTFNNGISGGANNDLLTMNAGTLAALAPGSGDDVINLFGGTLNGANSSNRFNAGSGDDVLVVDPTDAMSMATLDLTGINIFDGDAGTDLATFRNVSTDTHLVDNVAFTQWDTVTFVNSTINIDDSSVIANMNLVNSTMNQIDGDLNLSSGATLLSADGSSRVNMQDGAVDDSIWAQYNPSSGSVLAVDVDTLTEGLDLQDSDYIVGGTHTPEAGAIVNVAVVNNVGATSQRGSRRIVDSNAASVEAPGLGDRPNASATYVLQNDPSFGARQFWLQDDANGGVYLVWTTPVSPVTMAAILGGAASGAALNPDGTLDLTDPNLMVDPNAKGAGLDMLAAANTSSFIADSINGNSGRASLDCNTGRRDWNLWGNLGAETGEYGQSEMDTGYAAIGAEKDISSVANAECGRYKAGVFAFTSHSEIEHPLLGNDKEPNSYGLGAYLRGATESNFYGSVMGYIGETDYNGVNAVLESRFEYDSSDWGARLDVGKLIPLNDRGNLDADITGYVGITNSSADSFADSNDFVTSSIDNDGLNYGASVGLNKHYENNQTIFGRVGVDFNDIESELVAYTIPVNSEPSYTLGRVEAGYENTTENGSGTLRLSGIARFGSESEAYGARLMGIVRF